MSHFTRFSQMNFTGENYREIYLKTPHWLQLVDQLITSNPNAKCYICEKTYTLLLHHCRYDNLFHERVGRDIFILCFNCHTQVHFRRFLILFTRKTPLRRRALLKRMYLLRLFFCVRNRKFFATIKFIFLYLTV